MPATTTPATDEPRRRLPAWVGLLLVFLASRLLYSLAGVRFDVHWLGETWQVLDPRLLVTDLGRSLWHLHMQPPLFNLFLGLGLKIGPLAPGLFAAVYLLASFLALVATVRLLRWFGLPAAAALAVAALFYLGPTAVLYENYLFYTWPVAVLLLLAAVALRRYLERPVFHRALLFFLLLATVCLTRSVFHLLWLLAVVAALGLARPRRLRTTLAAALLPVILVVAVYAKNQAVFGQFSASSWMWLSLGKTVGFKMYSDEGQEWLRDGVVSPLAGVDPFAPPEIYALVVEPPPPTGVPALDRPRKSNGRANLNHAIYLEALPQRRRDFLVVLRRSPETYLGVTAAAAFRSLRQPLDYFTLERNAARVGLLRTVWGRGLYLSLPMPRAGPAAWWSGLSATVLFALLATLGGGLAVLVPGLCRRDGSRAGWSDRRVVFLFLALTVLYVAVVGVLLEVGENDRFRVMVEPLLLVATAVVVHRGWRRWRRRAGRAGEVAS